MVFSLFPSERQPQSYVCPSPVLAPDFDGPAGPAGRSEAGGAHVQTDLSTDGVDCLGRVGPSVE